MNLSRAAFRDQYVGIIFRSGTGADVNRPCAPAASAAPVARRAPWRADTRVNKSAGVAIAAGARILHSSRAGRNGDRKKIFSDYPRGFLRRLLLPASDALTVTLALPVAFFFARRRRPVTLLGLPPRPLPRRSPALRTAIALARIERMKTLFAAFQQTAARPRTAGRTFPPAVFLIFGRACRILDRAHGSVAPGKLMSRRGLASSPGRSRSGLARTQDSIAAEIARPGCFLFPACGAAVGESGTLPRLWIPQVWHTTDPDLSVRPRFTPPCVTIRNRFRYPVRHWPLSSVCGLALRGPLKWYTRRPPPTAHLSPTKLDSGSLVQPQA